MSKIICGCSLVIERIQDGKDEHYAGECETCIKNKGVYTKSPHWVEAVPQLDTQAVEDKWNPSNSRAQPASKTDRSKKRGRST